MGIKSIHHNAVQVKETPVHRIRNYINTEDMEALSIAEIDRIEAYDDWSQSGFHTLFFYIIEGKGFFELETEGHMFMAGDIFIVPPHSKYRTPAGVRLLAITTPRFKAEQRAH